MTEKNPYVKKRIALVLSGGGGLGAYQAQMINLIDKVFHVEYTSIAGVSVGALNAAMVVQRRIDRMMHIWRNIRESDVYKRRSILQLASNYALHKIGLRKPYLGAYSNEPLLELLKREIDVSRLMSSTVDYHIGRVDLHSGMYETYLTADEAHLQILASTAIPGVWQPTTIPPDDRMYVDGGVRDIAPLGDVLRSDPDLVIIIPTRPLAVSTAYGTKFRTIVDVVERTVGIMTNEIFRNDVKHFFDINRLVQQAEGAGIVLHKKNGLPYRRFDAVVCEPQVSLGSGLDFSRDVINERINHAEEMFRIEYKQKLEDKLRE